MDKKLKDEWIKALRSGKYTQGQGQLCNGVEYCCLGVLAEIALNKGALDSGLWDEAFVGDLNINGVDIDEKIEITLANMNDGINEFAGNTQSFTEIADWIEQNVSAE